MGLDMYLTASRYIWDNEKEIENDLQKIMKTKYRVKCVKLEIGYWRKANQIHKWFVKNVQNGVDDCGEYIVGSSELKSLLNDVNEALCTDTPSEILPTQSGFFFGSTEYDDNYFDDLRLTKDILESWLGYKDKENYDVHYQSSW